MVQTATADGKGELGSLQPLPLSMDGVDRSGTAKQRRRSHCNNRFKIVNIVGAARYPIQDHFATKMLG
jgi:hypothetical protein